MIKYEGHISYIEDLKGDFSARILFGALKFRIKYAETLEGGVFLFGFRIRSLEQIAEVQTNRIDEQSRVGSKGSSIITEQDYKDEDSTEDNNENGHHYADIETMKKLGKAGWHAVNKTKDTVSNLIRKSDSELRYLILDVFKNIMRQFLPRRIAGDFKYGLDDPYYTAKILEIFALFYAKVGDDLRVEPVWQGYCFLGSVEYDGKIHLTVILWNIIRLLANNQFRTIWREYNGK